MAKVKAAAAPAAAVRGPPAVAATAATARPAVSQDISKSSNQRRLRPRHVLQSLQRRLEHVQQQYSRLQAQHTVLAGAEAVLAELCEAMALIQLCQHAPSTHAGGQAAAGAVGTQPPGGADERAGQLGALLEHEGGLLQRLTEQQQQQQQQQWQQQQQALELQRASMLPRAPDAIAPASDLLYLYRRLAAPALEDVSQLTATGLARQHRDAARGAGLQLELLKKGSVTREAASRAIEDELLRLMRLQLAVIVANKPDVFFEHLATNVDTLQLQELSDAPLSSPREPAARAVAHVALTPLQEHSVALMLPLWRRCQGVLEAEMAQLRQHINADVASCSAAPCAASAAQPGGGAGGSGGAPAAPNPGGARPGGGSSSSAAPASSHNGDQALLARIEHLDVFAQRASRLRALLHKLALLNTAWSCWLIGQLSWLQAAELMIASYPFYPVYYHVGCAIRDKWQARRADEAEQPPAAAPSPPRQ